MRREILFFRGGRKNGTDLVIDEIDCQIVARFVETTTIRGKGERSRRNNNNNNNNNSYCKRTVECIGDMVMARIQTSHHDDIDNDNDIDSTNGNDRNGNGNENHRVFALRAPRHADLSSEKAAILLELDCLAELDLWDLPEIPAWIGRFQNLEVLKLQCTSSSKGLPAVLLPQEIGNLAGLIKLDLGSSTVRSLPGSIGMLRNLESLVLSSTTELLRLPHEIGNLLRLTHLDLHSSAIESLPGSIGRLENLEFLDLSSTTNLHRLPEEIGNLVGLVRLCLVYSAIRSLPRSIGRLANLEFLDLYSADGLTELPEEIGSARNLLYLDFGNSSLRSIPASVGKLKNLKKMALDGTPVLLERSRSDLRAKNYSFSNTARECRSLGCLGISLRGRSAAAAATTTPIPSSTTTTTNRAEWPELDIQLANNRARSRLVFWDGGDGKDDDARTRTSIGECNDKYRTRRRATPKSLSLSLWPLVLCKATKAFARYTKISRYDGYCKQNCGCRVEFTQHDAIFRLLVHHGGAKDVFLEQH